MAPSQVQNLAYLRWANRLNRLSASPADFVRQLESFAGIAEALNPSELDVGTVIVHLRGDRVRPVGHARVLDELIAGSKLIEVDGDDHLLYSLDNWREVIDPVIEFFTGIRPPHATQRRFAAIMFTDIVGSTQLLQLLGDSDYRQLIEEHDQIIHRTTALHRGRAVKSTGDGMLGVFDSPSVAIQAAVALRSELGNLVYRSEP